MTSTDNLESQNTLNQKMKFIDAIQALPDNRDKRGKKHSQPFLIIVFMFATLAGRSKVSSIHRYMVNKMDWLREVTGHTDAMPVSRSHMPRMLANLDWVALSQIITECFDDEIKEIIENEWIGIDGKVMRGSIKSGEKQAIIHAVSHDSRLDVAQARQAGDKSSEITVLREFIKEAGLESHKISMDAHHCNPDTLTQIHEAGGSYLVQVKENQPKLLEQCRNLSVQPSLSETIENNSANGRITTRHASLYDLTALEIDERWKSSGLYSLIVMDRDTFNKSTQKETTETSYYLSNHQQGNSQEIVQVLAKAIRMHWGVESNNWQLDVTFGEDHVRVKHGNQAQIMGKMRCFAMNLLRWSKAGLKNFQATIEKFIDSPNSLVSMFRAVNFL